MPAIVRRRGSWARWALVALIVGCGGGDNGNLVSVVTPASMIVTVTLSIPTLAVGQTTSATATERDQNGAAVGVGTLTWTSSNPAVASVNSAGVVTALAPGATLITATVGGISGSATLTVTTPAQSAPVTNSVTLTAAGQSTTFLTTPNVNVALGVTAGSQYLIAVVNTDATSASHEDFTLAGTFASSSSDKIGTATPIFPLTTQSVRPSAMMNVPGRSPSASARMPSLENHLGVLDDNRRIFVVRGNPRAAWTRSAAARGRIAPTSAAVVPAVGTVNKIYVKNGLSGTCTAVDSIGARTVAVGQHVIVLADTNQTKWPNAFRPDSSFYQTFANEFDQITYPHIIANIGDPLAFDGSLSGIGKITVTITPVLNNFATATGGGSVVAFVNGCDFFPFAASGVDADLSNQTEMFYSWVPSSTGEDVVTWEKSVRATAAHETKHIVSYTDRIINNSPEFEEIWLEEGLAQESSEIWERHFNQATFLGQATFAQTVACEINLGANAPCDVTDDKPRALIESHLPFFFDYLQTESASHSEGLGVDTPSNYGAGWTIARWATDQYATNGEGSFIKSLVNEPTLTGLANLSAHTGQPVPLVLVYWNLATAIFQVPTYTIADVRATIPSFNFADIFNVAQTKLTCSGSPCGFFTELGTPVFPIQPTALAAGAITNTVTSVPGTSAIFYLLTASAAGTQTVQLLSTTGTQLSPSSGFRLAILRVK